jgi:membrane protease YdiL (CAAX protease family)
MRFVLRYPLLSYFALAYLLTWAIEVPLLLAARDVITFHLPPVLEALAAFGPFAAALIVLGITKGRSGVSSLLASLGKWRVPLVWLLFALCSPFAVLFAALAITGETGKLLSGEICSELVTAGKMFELVLLGGVLRGIGEEPGWRGYALPMLRGRYGPLLATLALFPVWWLWHLPSFLLRPDFGLVQFFMFGLGILSASVWSTQLYDATRSVLMIALWHALINICRNFASVASPEAFMAFVQMILLVAVVIVIYWLVKRPGPVVNNEMA